MPLVALLKLNAPAVDPLHTVSLDGTVTFGVGLTVIVNVSGVPLQLPYAGVTIIVAVSGELLVLVAVNDAISPVPPEARPIVLSLFVQLYTVPLTAPLKLTAVVAVLLHTVWPLTDATVGVGLTVSIKLSALPGHPFADGVTTIVTVLTVLPAFVAVNDAIFPVPLDARPIVLSLFVHA